MEENNQNNIQEKYVEYYFPFAYKNESFVEYLNRKYSEGLIFIGKRIGKNGYFIIFEKKTKYRYIWKYCSKDKDFTEFINEQSSKGLKYIKSEVKNNTYYHGLNEDWINEFDDWNILFEETYV